ncbi:MAG: hypothetical protein RPU64_12700 [Candidatus Sedimenticola sp. (ex Thyasira tokunagai)]
MADILPFKKPRLSRQHKGNTLCRNGHHKWKQVKNSPFDLKQGKLVTRYSCSRCGATRTKGQ